MPSFSIARERIEGRDGLPDRYQTFIVKRDGRPIGHLGWAYRPKNAGGPAWRGKLFGDGTMGSNPVVYSGDKAKVLAWFKGGEAPP